MCRWLAYSGCPIYMSDLLFAPQNSLVNQSLLARKATVATNGDGFGLGWYGSRPQPGVFRDVRPAWNDDNLKSLSEQIEASLFFAHVRASTGTATSRSNCHPFRHQTWLFMHNGKIGGYEKVRRRLEFLLPEELYNAREGSTDSELFFQLMIAEGMMDDPYGAAARAAGIVETAMREAAVDDPLRLTAVFTDGTTLYAIRYSSDRQSPTLYYAQGGNVTVEGGECHFASGPGAVLVVSEPLDMAKECWNEVGEAQFLTVRDNRVTARDFAPTPPLRQAAE